MVDITAQSAALGINLLVPNKELTEQPNQSLEPTAGRRIASLLMTKTPSLQATLALASGGSAPSR